MIRESEPYLTGLIKRARGAELVLLVRWGTLVGIGFLQAQGWQDVGGGTNFAVQALLSWGGHLYVGGRFTAVGGSAMQAQGIVRWTGSGWQAIASPGAGGNGKINVITVYQGKIIIGGEFTGIGGTSANNIAAYDPGTGTWSAVGGGVNGEVHALYVYQGELLVGGNFTRVGLPPNDRPIFFFARWDGTQWKAPDPNSPSYLLVGGVPLAFAEYNGKLYVGGNFIAAYYNQTDKAYLAIWDKATQTILPAYPPNQGPDRNVWCLAVWDNKLYIGGEFQTIGGVSSPRLAALNGNTYEAVSGSPTSGRVHALLPTASCLYVAGSFASAGGQTVNRVACLSQNGTWFPIGPGLGPTIVNAIALYNNDLYAGGNFTEDGAGQPLARLAAYTNLTLSVPASSAPPVALSYSQGFLTLKAESSFKGTFALYNLTGQVLLSQSLSIEPVHAETLDLSHLPAGLYLVAITSADNALAFRSRIQVLP